MCACTRTPHSDTPHLTMLPFGLKCLSFCRQVHPKSPVGDVFIVLHRERQHVQDQDHVNIGGGSIKDYTFAVGLTCLDWECSTLSENSTESAVWLEFHFRGRSSYASVSSGGCW